MDACKLIEYALEQERREEQFRRYLVFLPNMKQDNFVSFEEFYDNTKPKKPDHRTKTDVITKILGV